MTLTDRTATEHLADLTAGRISSAWKLTRAYLDQIKSTTAECGPCCESILTLHHAGPEKSTAAGAAGQPLGRLAGLPVAIKDVLCTQGEPTTCGSRMLERTARRTTRP